jgi:NAD(P) transhydrogenase subunit alpha
MDLAGERGGNCALSKVDETVVHDGVTILAPSNLPGKLSGNASHLYAKNLQNFLDLVIGKDGALSIDWNDEIVAGAGLIRDGEFVHPLLKPTTGG